MFSTQNSSFRHIQVATPMQLVQKQKNGALSVKTTTTCISFLWALEELETVSNAHAKLKGKSGEEETNNGCVTVG